ncbi:MAG: hypothetical protein AAF366_20445 [Pseudomonadota bacterium]
MRALFLLATHLLTGCSAVTLAGIDAAARLDPLGTPPDAISVAVAVPPQLQLRDGDAVLRIALAGPDGPLVSETVPLRIVPATDAVAGTSPADRLFVARVGPAEAARFAGAQAEIRRLRAADQGGRGSLTVAVRGGCLTAPLGDTLPVTTWLRPAPDADFVQLSRRSDVLARLDPDARDAFRAALSPCP